MDDMDYRNIYHRKIHLTQYNDKYCIEPYVLSHDVVYFVYDYKKYTSHDVVYFVYDYKKSFIQ